MQRKIKRGSGMYAFLEKEGLLEQRNPASINAAKKRYYTAYKREWKKAKKKESKSFQIFFNFRELKIICAAAKKYKTSNTNYIKQSALATNKHIVDPVAIGSLRRVLFLNYNAILDLSEQEAVPDLLGNKLLNQMLEIEEKVLTFLHQHTK